MFVDDLKDGSAVPQCFINILCGFQSRAVYNEINMVFNQIKTVLLTAGPPSINQFYFILPKSAYIKINLIAVDKKRRRW